MCIIFAYYLLYILGDSTAVIPMDSKYRKVEVTYTKQGIEEIDYRMYNKTVFVALESLVPNAYCNSLVQV